MRLEEVLIEAAQMGDVEEVLRLERTVEEAPHWEGRAYVDAVGGEGGVERRMVVARHRTGGQLLGFAVAAVMGVGQERWGELESVAMVAAWRRVGVGRAMCLAMMAWCGERGARWVELEVRASSAGARSLYGQLGFAEHGLRRGYYRAPVEDAILMRAVLDDPLPVP